MVNHPENKQFVTWSLNSPLQFWSNISHLVLLCVVYQVHPCLLVHSLLSVSLLEILSLLLVVRHRVQWGFPSFAHAYVCYKQSKESSSFAEQQCCRAPSLPCTGWHGWSSSLQEGIWILTAPHCQITNWRFPTWAYRDWDLSMLWLIVSCVTSFLVKEKQNLY